MHSSRMRTVRNSSRLLVGGLHPPEQAPPGVGTPREQAPPWEQAPPGQIPLNFPLGCGPGPDPPQLPPWLLAWTRSPSTSPLAVGLDQIPLNFPLGCGPGDLQGMLGYPPPPRPAARHAGMPPARHAGITSLPPPWTDRHL